ncbi:UNVERIFIED_CONTAM: hypothetical protein FKN15_030593 [Acipenser sinensis]
MIACCVSGERLKAVRTRLIEGLNASVIRDLLDDMLHMNVLNDGEVESVKEGQTCTKDKASCLIDMYIKTPAVLEGLLKDLQEMKQLSDEEVEEVKKQASTQRMTSHLTSMVIKKGDAISRILFRMIPKYIKTPAVLEGLLKDLQEMKQLSDEEVEEVKKQASTQRMTSHLTSMVIKKGDAISENFLSKLAERDSEFYRNCSHDLDPVWRLREVQPQFAKRVSDAVIEGLLKDMLEMKVLSVEEVRDAPQNTGLQPWLVEQINSGRYPRLSWTNEALKQFRIQWKHDSTPEDTMIFKGWAVATGCYREGIDKPDAAAWRRNFQCALAKDESLVLCADHSQDPVDPHKIYQIFSSERLKAVRTRLIEGLNASVIRDLLDDMLHMNVLNDGKVESVKEGQTCTKDKASCLIDMVRKKGSSASKKLISKLAERDPTLYDTLGLRIQSVD